MSRTPGYEGALYAQWAVDALNAEVARLKVEVKRLEAENRELSRQLIRNAALCGELELALSEHTKGE